MPLITGGIASGSWTSTPVTVATGPRERASQYARGMPKIATSAVLIVALSAEISSADHTPGVPNPRSPGSAKRMANAITGTAR
jgi:hypothetical protein